MHVNDQSNLHKAHGPIGGIGAPSNGYNCSSLTNAGRFSGHQWVTGWPQIAAHAVGGA